MTRLWNNGIMVAVVMCVWIAAGCSKMSDGKAKTLAGAESEKFHRLLELASSERGVKSHDALLELRDFRDERAVPVLETIIKNHTGTGDIFEFGAAQGLFCIGSTRAHTILKRYLLTEEYDAPSGIESAFAWQMARDKRDAFINQYHLNSTSATLTVDLRTESGQEKGQNFNFIISVKNATDKPVRIYDPKVYLGAMLVISDSEGHFVPNLSDVKYQVEITRDSFPELPAGGNFQFAISAESRWIDSRAWEDDGLPQPRAMVLHCGDIFHAIGRPGRITVYAMYSVDKRFAEGQRERLSLPPVWVGRVVSKPLTIDVQYE